MRARDLMSTHPSIITPHESIVAAARLMRERHVGILPVIDSLETRRLVGIITDRDIVVRCLANEHGADCRVRDHMTGGRLEWVGPGADADEVVAKMKDHHIRRVPVLDIDRGLIGIISVGDLTVRLRPGNPRMMEELEQVLSVPYNAERREPS